MITTKDRENDILLITGEPYEDHPMSPSGVIARVLDHEGYRVGVIEDPRNQEALLKLGIPKLFVGVTSGSIDSMLNNYTPMKRKRANDPHSRALKLPNRAVIFYSNLVKRHMKGVPLVIGGIESSLRRFAHYDYWDNGIRRSILQDSRADLLVFGNGEKQVIEIAGRLRKGKDMGGIEGTCELVREKPKDYLALPSFDRVTSSPKDFCRMQAMFTNRLGLAQEYLNSFVVQHPYPTYTTEDLDRIYSLNFSRKLRKGSNQELGRFSVVTHRGCIGNCRFCSLALHQGDKIISRSEKSILEEIERISRHPDFRGIVDDLGGPSANMYGMDCDPSCEGDCLSCSRLDRSHDRITELMKTARDVDGVKRVFIRSGIRYDLALDGGGYLKELARHHVSGTLKIAPEHFSPRVLELMNKDNSNFDRFLKKWDEIMNDGGDSLRYYLMVGHPGDDEEQIKILLDRVKDLSNIQQFQMFTPTPMSPSTCMYWTGMDPFTMDKITVVRDYHTKKRMKRMMLDVIMKVRGKGFEHLVIDHRQGLSRTDEQ